jgi:YggT family protein
VIVFLITAVDILTRLIILLLIVHVVLTYFMSPLHPIRQWIDRFIEPILNPIRRIIPTVGMFDFSPLILIILVQIVSLVIRNLLISLL